MDVEKIGFRKLFRDIKSHVDVGIKLYRSQRTEDDTKFYEIFKKLETVTEQVRAHQIYLATHVSKYDFVGADGVAVKGNGYRSVLYFMSCILQPLHESLQKAAKERSSFRFSASEHINSLYLYYNALYGVERFACYSCKLMESTPAPYLFNSGELCQMIIRISIMEYFSREVFYGRLFGIQYSSTVRPVLKMLGVAMASYEQWYLADKDEPGKQVQQVLASLWKGGRYIRSPTRLGLKLDSLTTDCHVQFVKAFWSLSEKNAFQSAVKLVSQSVEILQWIEVPSQEIAFEVNDDKVVIKPPSAYLGYKPIQLMLISYKWRGAQPYGRNTRKKSAPLSPNLIFHIHGGGYVAQSPKSHEMYLREWAYELDVPIVSIAYSLSPEAPYPRALEECVLAYCWVLQNLEICGTTGEKIMFVGDSAGGNLVITASMKLKELGIRLPNSILSVYPSTNSRSSASPSRIMAIVDPILPVGVMLSCQQAYTNRLPTPATLSVHKEYRRRIMRAQGYYLPDSEDSSSSWKEKRSSTRRKWFKSKSSTSKDYDVVPGSTADKEGAAEMTDMGSLHSKAPPPPRPPPPSGSVTSVQLQAASSPRDDSTSPLANSDGSMMEVSLGADSKSYQNSSTDEDGDSTIMQLDEDEDSLSKLAYCFKQKPKEEDKLSPSDLEELVQEIMKSYDDGDATKDPFMSPMLAPDELLSGLPPIHIIGAGLDPILDDAVGMAHRLKSAQQPVTLNIANNLPHGFLPLVTAGKNPDRDAAKKLCMDYMKEDLDIHD